jgi:hypothetical protein
MEGNLSVEGAGLAHGQASRADLAKPVKSA